MVLTWFLKSRKAVTAVIVVIAALVVVGLGVYKDDSDLIGQGLVVAGGTAVSLILAVAYEDGSRVKVTEDSEQKLLNAMEKIMHDVGLDDTVIAALRSLADSAIETEEEEKAKGT